MDGIGDGTGRACGQCQTPLGPNSRFCPRCGQPADAAAPGGPLPGGPGGPGTGLGEGPGYTVVTPPDRGVPAPGWGAPAGGWPEQTRADRWPDQTRTDWNDQTVTQLPGRALQAPLPSAPPQNVPYVPPAYDGPAYGQVPQNARFESFRSYEPAGPVVGVPGGEPPLGPPSGPFQGPRQPPRRHDRDRAGTPLALWVIVLVILLGGGAAAGLLIAHPFSHPSLRDTASTGGSPTATAGSGNAPASPAAAASTTPSSAPATSAAALTEQQAATTVAAMLQQSVSDRAAINAAYNDVMACDTQMSSAPTVFDNAASSRQKLLASLGTMPGRAALPPALLSDLTQAWQASIAADQAFAQWASDEAAGCTPDDTSSPAYQATVTPDANATKYKTAFATQWNQVAARYNLTQYQQQQL